ncbi:MAG: LysM peptidoglycan-binding domain-containing protein [Candidatus Paceibacterota bacterium]|jgi:murein DD-endopeptidase MepM/ murein hydrolase activator NlpD
MKWFVVVSFPVLTSFISPAPANAGLFSFITELLSSSSKEVASVALSSNSQNLSLLQNTTNYDLTSSRGGGDITVVNDEALMSESGPAGTMADIDNSSVTGQISKYTVRKGDTLSSIAKMFGVSTNTVLWANNLPSKTIKEGQILVILPVSGTIHTIAKGDTLKSIAKKYKGDTEEIAQFNELSSSASLSVGDTLIIPDGESVAVAPAYSSAKITARAHDTGGPSYSGYYIRPLSGGIRTQGLHGFNAIDFGARKGTPILASAAGEVIISKTSGWNSGYGRYVVISHGNGTQTLYAHLNENFVFEGQTVYQGQPIGSMGNTGKVIPAPGGDGTHLHFEVRGAKNPFQ